MFLLSRLLGQPVRDVEHKSVGSLVDMLIVRSQPYPLVSALVIRNRSRRLVAPWRSVASIEESGCILSVLAATVGERQPLANELPLGDTFLDRQLVDRDGRKVIRVNDIQLSRTGDDLFVVGVDVSSGALLRRLGLPKAVGERLAKRPRANLIDWRTLDWAEVSSQGTGDVHLTVPRGDLSLVHPADLADIVHELAPEERAAVFEALGDEVAADAMEEMHPSFQAATLLDMPVEEAARIVSAMSPDDAADLLADMPEDRRERLIALMEKDEAEDVTELLSYPEHSAGGIMTTEFAQVPPDATAGEALELLREQSGEVETVYYIYVLDKSERLKGVISLRDLLVAPAERRVRDFMTKDVISVPTGAGEEEITQLIAKYNLLALPVVGEKNVLRGIITVDDAIDLVLPLAWKKRLPRIFH